MATMDNDNVDGYISSYGIKDARNPAIRLNTDRKMGEFHEQKQPKVSYYFIQYKSIDLVFQFYIVTRFGFENREMKQRKNGRLLPSCVTYPETLM